MDRLGKRRITKPLAWFMLYLMPISGGLALFLILSEVFIFLGPRAQQTVDYVRTIIASRQLPPSGAQPLRSFVYGWLAIVVAVVIHESAHGIVARSLGLPDQVGGADLLLLHTHRRLRRARRDAAQGDEGRDSLRVLAAGSGINFIVGLVCLVLLLLTVSAMVPAANGSAIVGVEPDASGLPSPAPARRDHAGRLHSRDQRRPQHRPRKPQPPTGPGHQRHNLAGWADPDVAAHNARGDDNGEHADPSEHDSPVPRGQLHSLSGTHGRGQQLPARLKVGGSSTSSLRRSPESQARSRSLPSSASTTSRPGCRSRR